MDLAAGQPISVLTSHGHRVERVAVRGVEPGYDFPVVWACSADEWVLAQAEAREPDAFPFPAEDVAVLADA